MIIINSSIISIMYNFGFICDMESIFSHYANSCKDMYHIFIEEAINCNLGQESGL